MQREIAAILQPRRTAGSIFVARKTGLTVHWRLAFLVGEAIRRRDANNRGVFTTPATVIDGEIVVGFDRKRLGELLGPR